MRLDVHLVHSGHFLSRTRAQGAIRAGLVRIKGEIATQPSEEVGEGGEVSVDGDVHDFVSRGGVKLGAALKTFEIDPAGKICLDLGASTGGFTDALLRAGAATVYAVDVGTGQLHRSLVGDPRVANLEKTHAKELMRAIVPEEIDVLVCDVSFISLKKALPSAMALCTQGAQLIALIKPQFEMGPKMIGKGGLVEASALEVAAMIENIKEWVTSIGWRVKGVVDSPITGGDGNREFLLGATRSK